MTATTTPTRRRLTTRVQREILLRAPHRRVPGMLGVKPRHDRDRERDELRAYLGDAFDERHLNDPHGVVDDELEAIGDEELLYRTSQGYLYNLTSFAMARTKDPYLAELEHAVPAPARLLEYGCGIGSDGLCLIEAGYEVAFADFANPSTRYLRWRLEHRGQRADVYDIDADEIPGGFELAFAFDVIEHVADPFAFLAALESRARRVLVNLLEPIEGETGLHHPLPVAELLRHAAERGLQRYERHHGCSHLVLYEPGAPSRPRPVRRALRAAERLG